MKRDALAFFRILPAGAADLGEEVSREDLRAAGLGDWSMRDVGRDDLGDVFGPEFDEVLPFDEAPTNPGVGVTRLGLGRTG